MKRFILLLLLFSLVIPTASAYTVEELQEDLGIHVESESADTLKGLLIVIDESLYKTFRDAGSESVLDLRSMTYDRLIDLDEQEWVLEYILQSSLDYESLKVEDLIVMRDYLNSMISAKSGDTESSGDVEVPAGIWLVGEDIPAGEWEIHAADNSYMTITIGDKLTEGGRSLSFMGDVYIFETLVGKNNWMYDKGDQTYITVDLKDGYYIDINGPVIFRKHTGKPDLGFDWGE